MTASDLLNRLGENHLLHAPQIEELRAQLSNFNDAQTLAQELVQRNWLTPHQVDQVLQGNGDPLVVGAAPEEATAELTARPLAQAIPMTGAVPADVPIVHAVPVQAAAVHAVSVGQAIPIAAPVAQAAADIPAAARPKPSRARSLLLGGGAIALLAITGVVIAMFMRGSRPGTASKASYPPSAALAILPLEPVTFKEGNSKFVIVKIERKDFMGPVELSVQDPPEGIRAQTITLSDNQDIGQFRLTVSFTTPAMKTDLRVVARAGNLYAETLLPLTVVTDRNDAPPD